MTVTTVGDFFNAEEFLNAWTVFKPNEKDTSAELVSHFDKQLEMYQLCSELLADGKLDTDELVLRINKHVIQDLKLMYDWMLDNMDMVPAVRRKQSHGGSDEDIIKDGIRKLIEMGVTNFSFEDPVVDSFRAMIGMVRCAPAHYFDKLDLLLPEPSFPPSPLSSPHSETNKENGIEVETIQNSDVERRGRSKKTRARGTISDTTDLNCNATKDGRRHSQPTTPTTTIHLANEKGTKNGMLAKVHRFCSNIDLKVESNIKHKPAPKITTRTRMKNEAYGKTNSGAQCISGRTRTVQLTGVSGDASGIDGNQFNNMGRESDGSVSSEPEENMSMCRDSSAESVATSSASRDSSTENVSDHGKKSVWMHRDRLVGKDIYGKCFVCREAGNQKLLQCSKKYPGGGICSTRFHDDCLKTYNAGDFNADYVCELFDIKGEDTFVCPLHHCDLCYFERKKCTAVTGAMIQCSKCYRAFHEVCRPAGGVVKQEKCLLTGEDSSKIEVKLQTTICHVHSREEHAKIISNSRSHLPFCCECEEKGKEALLKCSQCIRSYHQRCRTVDLIEGNRYPPEKPICEGCIHGESLRIGQHVIAKFQNTFYAGTCVTLDEYPEHCASADKYGKHLGEPGFVALTWAGCHNLFSLLPARTLVPMFQGSFHLIGKRMSDRDHYNAWLEMDQNIVIPRPERETVQDRYTKVKTSVYHKDCQKPRLNSVDESDVMCDCMESEPDRCGPGSKCTNRAVHQECPESCEKRPGGCQNRSLSRRETNPNIVVMKTKGKGDGVFAKRRIPKDSFIAEYAGEIISLREKNRRIALSAKSKNDEEKHYMMALDNHRVIDCKKKGNVARFLNHSCDPNCKVDTLDVVVASNKQGKSTFVKYDKRVRITTIKEIEPGIELCFNYDMEEFSVGCPLPECLCSSENCTGKLGKTGVERKEERMLKTKVDSKRPSPSLEKRPTMKRKASDEQEDKDIVEILLPPVKRGRGRPPRDKIPTANSAKTGEQNQSSKVLSKVEEDISSNLALIQKSSGRNRGRPKKDLEPTVAEESILSIENDDKELNAADEIIEKLDSDSHKTVTNEKEPNVSVLYDIPDSKQMTFQNHYFPVHGIEQVEPNPFIDEASKQTYIDKIKSKATIPSVPRDEEVEEELVLFTPRKPGDELGASNKKPSRGLPPRARRGYAPTKLSL